ncbi:ABC transporter substrate-binding protein [Nonomuraea jiangxiensis]|uniref:ABC-type branched-chain amino acid transport system, substrate-binding protein n=1 Tax=Nonomuraea jiangxiensis TaxID=633440 RepID=A0A1G9IRG8_9ACTN|nr:ABC transporter substrate-binding protein [Nonomuraea jiangxiensis]SDL27583.1 ABC-type branched-chain amino acid transport system, substrate-binding protein [Nonomuraea jiangxiensis]
MTPHRSSWPRHLWERLRHWWQTLGRLVRWGVAVGGALLVLAAVGIPSGLIVRNMLYCDPYDIRRVSVNVGEQEREECVGVSGTYAFEPRFAEIVKAMAAENAFATKGGPGSYYTIAFLGPLTQPEPRVVHQLEGAVAAQHRANHGPVVGQIPPIKLVLANTDSMESNWRRTTEDLLARVDSEDRLVAVAGLGRSTASTLESLKLLATKNLAMVGDAVTSDAIDRTRVPGFVRVNPRVSEQVSLLAKYVGSGGGKGWRTAALIHSAKPGDLYADSLAAEFKRHMKTQWDAGGNVDYPFGDPPGNQWRIIMSNLCARPPDVIFYAGRGSDLHTFVNSLRESGKCLGPVNIVTGSDVVRLRTEQFPEDTFESISLTYVPLAEPSLFKCEGNGPYQRLLEAYQELKFDEENLGTGWGIMAHDAVLAAAQAVRDVAGDSSKDEVTPGAVSGMLPLYALPNTAVSGASGSIMFDSRTGNRLGLALPVLRFRQGAAPEVLSDPRRAQEHPCHKRD